MLLDHLIAADPDIGIPGAMLPLQAFLFVEKFLALDDRTADPVGVGRDDIADFSVLDLLNPLLSG